ncbi:MAG TPA: hypothetical protein VF837_04560 [Patescibacteria group bacterium]
MLLVIEIILTTYASVRLLRAGHAWALGLIPILSGMGLGFLLGVMAGLGGATAAAVVVPGLVIDLCVVGVLIWMILANKPK